MKSLIFGSLLMVLFLTSCQKESLLNQEDINPNLTETMTFEQFGQGEKPGDDQSKANEGDCHFNRHENQVIIFNYCGTDYVLQGELNLTNVNGFHFVEASAKCHKLGDPDVLVKVTEISVELEGNLSIWCKVPINVQIPNDYNTNLENGAVPYHDNCHDCGSNLVRVTYIKNVTLQEGNEILKGHFRLKMDHCGATHEEEMTIEMIND